MVYVRKKEHINGSDILDPYTFLSVKNSFRLKQFSEDLFPKKYQGTWHKFNRLTRPTHYSFRQALGLENL